MSNHLRFGAALILLAVLAPARAMAQAPPDTDVFLASLERDGGAWSLEGVQNLTARPGYDNQPAFTPDGRAILYTSVDEDGRADIWRYDLERRAAEPMTRTPESEYSATPVPGSSRFSVVRVERDSTQRLWSFAAGGGDARLVLPDVRPVGYHAWADSGTVVLYVLGEPSTLRVASPGAGEGRVVSRDVGRSLQRIPGTGAVSFVALAGEDDGGEAGGEGAGQDTDGGGAWVTRLEPESGETRRIAPALDESVDHAWTPDGTLLMGHGSVLYRWDPAPDGQWRRVADLSDRALGSITRLAVSPDGDRIALVAEPDGRKTATRDDPAAMAARETAGNASDLMTRVEAVTSEHARAIIEMRHTIHRNPELGNREHETAALVAEHLRGLGFDRVETGVAHTGVVGILRGGQPGPVVAVRADMDALPVKEQTGFPFASTDSATWEGRRVPVMHACGHDIHTSVGLGVATVLAEMRAELPGTVKFIFQPAEEGPPAGEEGGAPLMMKEGVLQGPRPEAIFALHSYPQMEVGELGYTPGPALAAVDHFYITIEGEQAHGARPHQSVDPVVMAAQAVTALQTIRSRNLNPLEPSVVTVGMIHGGERFNIIPDQVELEGTVRTYDEGVRDAVERRMEEILAGITQAGGGSYQLTYDRNMPATINDRDLTARVAPALERTVGEGNVRQVPPTMGGEDFAYFAREIPGFYFRLGTTKPGTESGGLHTPTFRGADSSVPVGIRAMTNVVLEYLSTAESS